MVTTGAVSSAAGPHRFEPAHALVPGALNQIAPSGPIAIPVG